MPPPYETTRLTGKELVTVVQDGFQVQVPLAQLLPSNEATAARNEFLFGVIGDSTAASFSRYGNRAEGKQAWNEIVCALALMGQRVRCGYFGGMPNRRTDQWLTQPSPDKNFGDGAGPLNNLDALIASKVGWVVFNGDAINDLMQHYTADQIWNGYAGSSNPIASIGLKAAYDRCIAAGIKIIICSEVGAVSPSAFVAADLAEMNKLNRLKRKYAADVPGAYFFDRGPILWDATSQTTNAIVFKTGVTQADGVHRTALGGQLLGAALAAFWAPLLAANDRLPSSAADIKANGAAQYFQNPLFVLNSPAGTAGSLGGTNTGTIPTGVAISRNGSNVVASVTIIDDPNGFGKAFQIDATSSAAGSIVTAQMDIDVSDLLATGASFFGNFHAEVAAGSSGMAAPAATVRFVVDGATYEAYDFYNDVTASARGPGPTTAYKLDLETGIVSFPAGGAVTSAFLRLTIGFYAAGSGRVTITRAGMWKA